ncbi:putative proteasome endopeptidase complex [Helianthus annuus]|nr:putative proteasome endopeptidase complex [Helianthus annuus]
MQLKLSITVASSSASNVMGVEKLIAFKIMSPGSNCKIHFQHCHSAMGLVGLAANVRNVARAKSEAHDYSHYILGILVLQSRREGRLLKHKRETDCFKS